MQPIDFVAFAEDCLISGKMTMFGERLTDFMNGQERFRVHHLECESLEDGHLVALDSVSLERRDLLAVVANGPRGSEKQRIPLQTNRLQLSIGPYLILGHVHTAPGSDAMTAVLKREPMIPLTDVTIAYELAGSIVARDVPTIIVNRLLVDWISPTSDAATFFPDVPVRSPFTARLQKDFTGSSSK
ncbi:MAG: hypothetical protein QOI37_466 [Chloroflexota bacterium]|jgi:hypothetical protein|nr:hypothetical protein [Chloroflexota bacterium]